MSGSQALIEGAVAEAAAVVPALGEGVSGHSAPAGREDIRAFPGPGTSAGIFALPEVREPVGNAGVDGNSVGRITSAGTTPDIAVLDVFVQDHRDAHVRVRLGAATGYHLITGLRRALVVPVGARRCRMLARRHPVEVGQVDLVRQGDVLDIREALDLPRRFTRVGEDRKQHGCQDRDDRDHD